MADQPPTDEPLPLHILVKQLQADVEALKAAMKPRAKKTSPTAKKK